MFIYFQKTFFFFVEIWQFQQVWPIVTQKRCLP